MALKLTASVFIRSNKLQLFPTLAASIYSITTRSNSSIKPNLRFIQYLRKNDDRKRLGVVSDDGNSFIELSGGSCVSNDMITFINQNYPMSELAEKLSNTHYENIDDSICLLPPITNPEKIICVGLNYKDHCEEQKKEPPKEPVFFSKFNNALTGPRGCIIAHKIARRLDYEVELAVIIGKKCKCVTKEEAMDCVFGYSVAQDITARDWQKRNGGQFLIGKSMDSFLPLGPALVHKSLIKDPHDLQTACWVNSVEKQNSNTGNMIFRIDDMISRLSQSMTLMPGDIILTGTPSGVGMYRNPPEYLKPGDVIKSEIQCLGRLLNEVVGV